MTTAQCEHISYILNDAAYNLVTFVFEGTPTAGLTELLSGTPFSVGTVEATERVEGGVHRSKPAQPPERPDALY